MEEKNSELAKKEEVEIVSPRRKAAEPTLIQELSRNAPGLVKLGVGLMEGFSRMKESESRRRFRFSIFVLSIILVIVISASFLTFYGMVESSVFAFLMGVIVGYLLTTLLEFFPSEGVL